MTALQSPVYMARFGSLEIDPANVRKTAPEPSPALIASIKKHGVIVPLIVRPADESTADLYVTDGGKRLRALKQIGTSPEDLVPVRAFNVDAVAAEEISLVAAIIRDPLHPVDEYERFAALVAEGATPTDLKRDFAMTEKRVSQVLALGRLSPKIRAAWRDGIITAEAAERFTLANDHKHQDAVFNRLQRQGRLDAWTVRRELATADADIPSLLAFVGIDAYRAAGGGVIEDLFSEKRDRADVVADPALLRKLSEEKLEAERKRLLEQGWSWVEPMPPQGTFHFAQLPFRQPKYTKAQAAAVKRLGAEAEKLQRSGKGGTAAATRVEEELGVLEDAGFVASYTDEDRAKAGCFYAVEHHGGLRVEYGLLKVAKGKAAAEGKSPRSADAKTISDALTARLAEQLTLAAGDALVTDQRLALAVLLAGFEARDGNVDVVLKTMATVGSPYSARTATLESAIEAHAAYDRETLVGAVCKSAAAALNFRAHAFGKGAVKEKAVKAIVDRLPAEAFRAALAKRFDAADYFSSASATVCKAAMKEMAREVLASWKKPALAEAAAAAAAETGWLPVELRTSHYEPPRATGKPKGGDQAPGAGKARAKAPRPAPAAAPKRARAK